MTEQPSTDEDRRKHLDFIQAVVTRMSTASSNSKSWALPIVTATYGYALTQKSGSIALLGITSVLLFAFLDANYLSQERKYRKLYDAVAGLGTYSSGARRIGMFSMNTSEAEETEDSQQRGLRRLLAIAERWFPSHTVWSSWSIAPFYGVLGVVGLAIAFYAVIPPILCP
ncbi:hypothetical protein [Arthrobacter pityocampae]|uniref:hypothetical protein n=1 Tax=Arthrobacter pityocampae TaxID=547334 RepID=UPI0011B0DF27|nr:hypothetical protein [Arthrobacter pityocampae]